MLWTKFINFAIWLHKTQRCKFFFIFCRHERLSGHLPSSARIESIVCSIFGAIHEYTWNGVGTLSNGCLCDLKMGQSLMAIIKQERREKVYFKVLYTGTRVLDNTRPFLCSSTVNFWITLARSTGHINHIWAILVHQKCYSIHQYWDVPVSGTKSIPCPKENLYNLPFV